MVVVPRMHVLTVRVAMRMLMVQRMAMPQRVPARSLFPPGTSVPTAEPIVFDGDVHHEDYSNFRGSLSSKEEGIFG